MATKKDLTKEEKIKREFSRLKRIFKDLDKKQVADRRKPYQERGVHGGIP